MKSDEEREDGKTRNYYGRGKAKVTGGRVGQKTFGMSFDPEETKNLADSINKAVEDGQGIDLTTHMDQSTKDGKRNVTVTSKKKKD